MEAADPKPPKFKPRSLVRMLMFLGKYPGQVGVALGLVLLGLGIELWLPQVLGEAINGLRAALESGQPFAPIEYTLLFLVLAILRAVSGYVLGPIRNRLVQQTLNDIRAAIYDALQRLAFGFHDKSSTGEMLSRATSDVLRLQDFFWACLFLSFDTLLAIVATVGFILATSAVLGGLTLGTLAPTVLLIIYFAGKLQPRWREIHDLRSAMVTVIQENIAGVRVVKAFAQESNQVAKFTRKKDDFVRTVRETINYWAARVPLAQLVFGLTVPVVLWAGGKQVISGQLPIGDLAKVVFYLMGIGHRLSAVGQLANIVQNAGASSERILEVIQEPQTIRSGLGHLPPGPGHVVFDHVSFEYRDGKASLHEIDFEVAAGQTIAVVGATGAGKTTLVNLIPRFYDVSSGSVRVDGVDVREVRLDELRRSIGVIFQDTFLFSTTVAENIAYGRPSANRFEIEAAAQAAQADEFIAELEHGYETLIGERGVTLSGGQRQRLAIARAFLMNPRILILDDATASVDARTEHLIEQAMRELCRGRTTFVIAHRFSTVQHADQIIVLHEGRIAARGRHEELIRTAGFYQDIFRQQIRKD